MNTVISTIERYVIESLLKDNRNFNQLADKTGLNTRVLTNTLNSLLKKELISQVSEVYIANKASPLLYENLNTEKEILVKTCLNNSCNVKTYVYHLDPLNQKVLNSLLKNIEDFLEENSEVKEDVKSHNILFWGKQNYHEAISSLI